MNNISFMLMADTYKNTNPDAMPDGLTKLTSYITPRKSMFRDIDKVVFFGLQGFIKEFLIDLANETFFNRDKDEVLAEYKTYLDTQIGANSYDLGRIEKLYDLGYLPIRMKALPEGSIVDMGVPCIELTNTHPDFAWVVQWVECVIQSETFGTCNWATIAHEYRKLANFYYGKTTDNANPARAMADFGFRGLGVDNGIRASSSWLLSFDKTSTIPAMQYIDKMYNADCAKNHIGIGAVSLEHATVCSNLAVCESEENLLRRLLTTVYKDTSFSYVSDTFDYWSLIEDTLPKLRKEINEHNGKFLVRPDSGNIVDISVKTVQKLYELFGGNVNVKGYKELNPKIGLIYGDGCQFRKINEIWTKLEELGFAANTILFGVGAYSFTAMNTPRCENICLTRDTFGFAMKSTYCVINDEEYTIQKNPKTDLHNLKKSHKGLCHVSKEIINGHARFVCNDGFTSETIPEDNLLTTVFEDGKLVRENTFMEIRERIDSYND